MPFYFDPYVTEMQTQEKTRVTIEEMTSADAKQTNEEPLWQTDWTSDFISDPAYLKYAVKTSSGELLALGAYEILKNSLVVHIIYIEGQPQSNPTLRSGKPKYKGIGRVLMAFGIKLSIDCDFGGDITFEAKTPELAHHYVRDFGAVPLPMFGGGEAPRYLISGEAAKRIFLSYLTESGGV